MDVDENRACWMLLMRAAECMRDYGIRHSEHKADHVTMAQQKLIKVVMHHPEGIKTKDIARELDCTPGAVSQNVEALVREGMLERVPSQRDRRVVTIRASEKCRNIGKIVAEHFTATMTTVFEQTGPDGRRIFTDVLRRLIGLTENQMNTKESARRALILETADDNL